MHHDEFVYPMDELVGEEFVVGKWDGIDIDRMRDLHSRYCRKKESCVNCSIEPFCYRGSYADTLETYCTLDGEFTSCVEKRKMYTRLMSIGNKGESIAKSMFN
jgi:radical SAM protein with 4Fe4S-binding SPASM domain